MSKDLQSSLQIDGLDATTILPPSMVDECAWDVLLALRSDRHCALSLGKLASLVSVSPKALNRWLATLEDEQLISGAKDSVTGELRASLTPTARQLLDTYLSASRDLRVGTHH